MSYQELRILMHEAWAGIKALYQPTVQRFIQDTGIEGRDWGLLMAVLNFEPENTTPAHLLVRGPYTAAEEYLRRLKLLAGKGYLNEVESEGFTLTARGRSEILRFIAEARQAMAEADPLPKRDSRQLAELLTHLLQSCLNVTPPPNTWSIRLSYKLMPPLEPPLPYIEQVFSCLEAYRDDAHLAAWRESSLTATALEVLTLLWRGEVDSFEGLVRKLSPRGHSKEVYWDSLKQLKDRNFVAGSRSALKITTLGKAFRDQIEEKTDQYFYIPWAYLDESELNLMRTLLERLRDCL